jgi:chromosome segregation ATPase
MFERLRAVLGRGVTAAQAGVVAAQAARDAAVAEVAPRQALLPALQDDVTAAAAGVDAATAQVGPLQAVVDQRMADSQQAQTALAAAQQRLADHEANEPADEINGHVNPAWVKWKKRRDELQRAVDNAAAAADAALVALGQAQQALAAAAAQVAAAQATLGQARDRLAGGEAAVVAAQEAVTAAEQGIVQAQDAVVAAQARVDGLDARAARLVAEPLDRTDLETAADAELADQRAALAHRHDAMTRRAAAVEARRQEQGVLDVTVDALAELRRVVLASPQVGRRPSLPALAAAIQAAVDANRAQRGRPVRDRADDVAALHDVLAARLADLRADLAAASADRAAAAIALRQAAHDLALHQRGSP